MDIKEKRSLLKALKDFIQRIKNFLKKHDLTETKAFVDDFEAINKLANMVNESVVTIRKSPQKNKFWVHHVYIENDTGSTSAGTSKSSKTAYTTSSANHTLTQTENKVKSKSAVNGKKRLMTDEEYATKLRAELHIDELSGVSKRGNKIFSDRKNHEFAKDGFNYRTAYFMDFDGLYYRLTISVGKNGIVDTVYNIGKNKRS